jgi:hypothetical protein
MLSIPVAVAPGAARTSGKESFKGVLVTSGESGTRTVVSTVLVAKGVFDGVGRLVEVDNRAGDPDNISRDDLVFARGTMHIVNTSGAVDVSLKPQTCAFTIRIEQTSKVEGGTRRFKHATGSFTGTVRAVGVAARAPDGSCSQELAALVEADIVKARGTLTF